MTDEYKKKVITRIREFRKRNSLLNSEIAIILGYAPSTFSACVSTIIKCDGVYAKLDKRMKFLEYIESKVDNFKQLMFEYVDQNKAINDSYDKETCKVKD